MKPTVSVDQCFILFLVPGNLTLSDGTACLLERFRLFVNELTIPSHAKDPPLLQSNDVGTVLQVAMRAAKLNRAGIAGGPTFSGIGASGNPGAFQTGKAASAY